MNWFYNLKVSAKLLTGFILAALLTGAVGIVGVFHIISVPGMMVLITAAVVLEVALAIFLSRVIGRPLQILIREAEKLAIGDLDVNIKARSTDEMGTLFGALGRMTENIREQAAAAEKISAGDLSIEINLKSEKDVLACSMKTVVETLRGLAAETAMLTQAAVEGRLHTRGNGQKFAGGYREIVEEINRTLDALIEPLNVAAEYVERISKGDIPAKITGSYNGDFNEIKKDLNQCIDAVNALVADADMLSIAAIEGKLSTRADSSRHAGDFRRIIEGVNNTLDAVIKPVHEAASVLKEMANGNLEMRMVGDYKGDHAEIKNALNDTLDALFAYVEEISRVLTEMANSDLDVEISGDYKGDFTQIKEALNLILSSFNQVLTEFNSTADQVANGSRQVSDGSQALSQGATEQASSVEQLTASINEIAAETKQNAVNANEAKELAETAKNNAVQGNSQMREMLQAMEEINVSSANISKIIKVIDEIAFQTNILALNAAVEAARAGQHGKGFAVVAEEVRNLAARSASAAKETTGLIEGSIGKVEAGTKIAHETAEALDKIVDEVSKAADLVGSIAAASNEQATGIAQVNQGVEQISQVVQTNSATAEQSAAASEELSGQAEMLKEMIGRFRMRTDGTGGIKMISTSSSKMKNDFKSRKNYSGGRLESTQRNKPRIALSAGEFGKY